MKTVRMRIIRFKDLKLFLRHFEILADTSIWSGCGFEFDVYFLRLPRVKAKVSPSR